MDGQEVRKDEVFPAAWHFSTLRRIYCDMKMVKQAVVLGTLAFALGAVGVRAQMALPAVKAHLYDDNANPRADIAAALKVAKREHKRVLVDFGGDWCGDCQVLDVYFHQPEIQSILDKYYVMVHVSVGHIDKNLDVPMGYGINIKKGVPAVAVLNAQGKVVDANRTGEFENMRNMQSGAVKDFLEKNKG